jgi:hypothetical protein
MKKTILALCSTSLFLFACNSGGTTSESKKDSVATTEKTTTTTTEPEKKEEPTTASTPTAMPDSATMAKNWQTYMTPGDVHKMMASWNGTWNGEVTMWMAPDAPPQTSKCMTVNKMAMGGRYQISTNTGNMMGMPFEGMGTMGYDNFKKTFSSTWIDNMGTGVMKLEGPWDEATKSITLKGKSMDPMMMKEVDVWEKFTVVDDNTQMMEMYGSGSDGKDFKTMEIKLTRKK